MAAKRRKSSLKGFPIPTLRQLNQHQISEIRPSQGGYTAYFDDDMAIHMHRGQGTGRIYAMRPMDLRHERREPTSSVRRVMQFAALSALFDYFGTSTDADFFVDADGDVIAQYVGYGR